MTTAATLIKRAMQKAGILSKTETPSADESADGLSTLNAMLSSWSNDSMMIYARVRETFTLTASQYSYTIGTGGDLNTSRPTFLLDAYITQATTDLPVEIITDEVYDTIPVKTTLGIPYFLNYNNDYPLAKILLYPAPSTNYSLTILSEKVLSSFSLTDTIDLPPGWEQALIYNLAVLLAPEYGQQIDPVTLKIAQDSKGSIQRAIIKNRTMDALPQAGRKGNVYNGWFR